MGLAPHTIHNIMVNHARKIHILSFCQAHGFSSGSKQTIYEVIYKYYKAGNMRAYYIALTFPDYFDFVNM